MVHSPQRKAYLSKNKWEELFKFKISDMNDFEKLVFVDGEYWCMIKKSKLIETNQ